MILNENWHVNVSKTCWNIPLKEIVSLPSDISPQERLKGVRSVYANNASDIIEGNSDDTE